MLQSRLMLVACVLLFGFGVASSDDDVTTTKSNTESTSLRVMPPLLGISETNEKSLDILKKQLRRNNDDFIEKSGKGTKWDEKSPNELLESNNRRAMNVNSTASSTVQHTHAPLEPKEMDGAPMFRASMENSKARKVHSAKKPVDAIREKAEKLRSFLDKYKVIVNEFMSNRTESPIMRQQSASQPIKPSSLATHKTSKQVDAARMAHETSKPEMRAEVLLPPGLDYHPPIAYQLDMSPARGGKVHSLRVRNRLCHRHVMVPEGPKYNSKGKIYLAEYTPATNKEFDHTNAPKFLLPKCCNCCRKSVLGCQ